jgi:hypothetical protein
MRNSLSLATSSLSLATSLSVSLFSVKTMKRSGGSTSLSFKHAPGSYLDVDVILAEEERLQLVFEKNEGALGLGFLDPATVGEDLGEGSKVEFPLWLVENLKVRLYV